MAWIGILLSIIPMISKLMQIAEQAFDDIPDSGAQKKEMVLTAVESLVDAVTGVTQGRSEIWEKIKGPIGIFIDLACSFLFKDDNKVAA